MPVPPQESAPSLSPRQSFGCQSPLPWVTGTDRTGSLGLCSSYRVPSRSSLLPLCTLSPGGVAHRPTSLTQSSTAWSQQSMENTDKCFPNRFSCHRIISRNDFGTGFMHRLAQLFPTTKGFFHSSSTQSFRFRKCAHEISQEQTQTPRSLDRGVHAFLRTITGFLFCLRITRRSLADWLT
jgi:hypothetical protein